MVALCKREGINMVPKSRVGLIFVAGTIVLLSSPKFRNKVCKVLKKISDTMLNNDNKNSSLSDYGVEKKRVVEGQVCKCMGNNVVYLPIRSERIKRRKNN